MEAVLAALVGLLVLFAATTLPASLVVVGERRGRAQAWVLFAVFAAAAGGLGGAGTAAWMTAVFAAPGFALAFGRRRGYGVEKLFLIAYAVSVLSMALIAAATAYGGGFEWDHAAALATTPLERRVDVFIAKGLVDPRTVEMLRLLPAELHVTPELALGYLVYLPGAWLAGAAIVIWLNLLSVFRFGASGADAATTDLGKWSAPEAWVFTVIAPALVLVFWDDPWASAVAGNAVAVAIIPFFFQGMAVTANLLRRLRLGPAGRFVAYALLLGIMGLPVVPAQAAVGVMDIWLDFRRLRKPPVAAEPPDDEKGEEE